VCPLLGQTGGRTRRPVDPRRPRAPHALRALPRAHADAPVDRRMTMSP
jgi:hypothetical protein